MVWKVLAQTGHLVAATVAVKVTRVVWHSVPMSATTAPPTSAEGGVDLRQL